MVIPYQKGLNTLAGTAVTELESIFSYRYLILVSTRQTHGNAATLYTFMSRGFGKAVGVGTTNIQLTM